jgi:hypothetical protein
VYAEMQLPLGSATVKVPYLLLPNATTIERWGILIALMGWQSFEPWGNS